LVHGRWVLCPFAGIPRGPVDAQAKSRRKVGAEVELLQRTVIEKTVPMQQNTEGERADGDPPEGLSASRRENDAGTEPATEHSVTVVLSNRYGLHMRPAKHVMELAHGFPCDIDLVAKGQEVDAKSILGIIGLGAECGDEVTIRARGPMATEGAEALGKLLSALPELHGEPRDIQ
jgi:phosphocarrier protein HPr